MVCLQGVPAAPGLAAGPIFRLTEPTIRVERQAGSATAERMALEAALQTAAEGLAALIETAGDDEEAEAILSFQAALLEDPELTAPAFAAIAAGTPADRAIREALDGEIAGYLAAEDAYFRGRAADLADLRDRVLRHLAGAEEAPLPAGVICVGSDLAPSRFLATRWDGGGLALARGSTTSHVAILARARGVPMVVGIVADGVANGHPALLDGTDGSLVVDPDQAARLAFEVRQAAELQTRARDEKFLTRPAVTADGESVAVMVNIAGPDDLSGIDPGHTDGIGLVRTEFLFHGRDRLPDEAEQLAVYRRILDWAGGRSVTIRTLDAGGDKPIPGLTRRDESNPFLGVRGVRLSLRHPEVFVVQLRALARAAAVAPLKVMVPMVSLPEEMAACRALLDDALAQLAAESLPAGRPQLGMMIEVPAAALMVEAFDAEFYSIGSNDLIQYTMAASRDEPELAGLARPNAALIALIARVAQYGAGSGRPVSLCGDLASEPAQVPLLLDAGLRALSVAPAALATTKAAVARYRRAA
ncbi:MAG: phosphoenolpyruvate--protein phosphotransferase [Azospirillum sp.]|nr:phosphoenolpyruvate--protein phosphotransferase [Azospirillum sp.]